MDQEDNAIDYVTGLYEQVAHPLAAPSLPFRMDLRGVMYDPASISQSPDEANTLVPQGSFAGSQADASPEKSNCGRSQQHLERQQHWCCGPFCYGCRGSKVSFHSVSGLTFMWLTRFSWLIMLLKMAEIGVSSIVVLGVDFMSENVRAVLDAAGHQTVPVYRVSERDIGCSLAESARNTRLCGLA